MALLEGGPSAVGLHVVGVLRNGDGDVKGVAAKPGGGARQFEELIPIEWGGGSNEVEPGGELLNFGGFMRGVRNANGVGGKSRTSREKPARNMRVHACCIRSKAFPGKSECLRCHVL